MHHAAAAEINMADSAMRSGLPRRHPGRCLENDALPHASELHLAAGGQAILSLSPQPTSAISLPPEPAAQDEPMYVKRQAWRDAFPGTRT